MEKTNKKSKLMLTAALVLTASLFSCNQETVLDAVGEHKHGQLTLTVDGRTDFIEKTRALNESEYENVNNYTVQVMDKGGNLKLECKGSELSSKLPLTMPIGSYTVKAFYGKESAFSRDEFYVLGIEEGSIKADQRENIEVVCTPTCGRITVNFTEEMPTYFADYNVTFSGTDAMGSNTIAWLKNDTEPWYVKLNDGGEDISFTITLVAKDEYVNGGKEQTTTKTGTFNLSRNKAYKMNISPAYTPSASGNLSVEVTIDESTNDIPVDIEVPVTWL